MLRASQGRQSISPTTIALGIAVVVSVAVGILVATNLPLSIAAIVAAGVVLVILIRPRIVLWFLLFSSGVPLNFVTGGQRSVLSQLGGTTVAGILLTVCVPSLIVLLIARGQLLHGVRVFALPVSFAAWSALTLAYSDWLDEGVRLAFKLWYPLLVGMLAYFICQRPTDIRDMRRWWYLGYAFASAIALVRLATAGLSVYGAGEVYRYAGLNHPSPFSFYVLVTFVLSFSLWTQKRRRLDAIVAATALLQVVLSMTRISIGALVVAMLLISIFVGDSLWRRLRGVLAALVVGAALLTTFITFPSLQGGVFFEPVTSVGEIFSDLGNLNTQGRDVTWGQVVSEYRTGDQFLGRGLGSSTRLFKEGGIGGSGKVAHSEYVRVLYEEGLVGLAWFGAVLLASIAFLAIRALKAEGMQRALLGAACVAVIVYGIVAVTDNALDYYNVFGQYVAVLAGAGLALRSGSKPTEEA